MDVRSPFFQNIALIVAGVMFLNPIVTVAAELSIDAQAGGNTTIGQAGNGVPIVNIATPNGSGLSHNKFTDYNVGQQGLILNNGAQAFVPTQQGGYITGNPNLRGGAANVILNEVTGSNRSQLKGYTEVAGQAAHVIVANPHGITCDGCGFINTPRATLSTGAPVVNNGRLQGFDVNGGDIAIEGAGLNASNVDQFDLITRSAQINAEIHAKRLNVIAGRNEVDVATLQATAKADDGSQQPQLAIDSSALGGMYAGAIRLVGTEAGVGVKLAGDMAASAGDIQIDASGQLTTNRMAASNDVTLVAKGVELNADTYAGRIATITAAGNTVVKESLAAGERIIVQAAQLDNQSTIEAGVRANGSTNSAGHLQLDGGSVRNTGQLTSHGTLSTDLQKLDNQNGKITAAGNATLEAKELDNRSGEVVAQGNLTLDNQVVDNRKGSALAGQALSIKASTVDNSAGTLAAGGAIEARVTDALNNDGGLAEAGSRLDIEADSLSNARGRLRALGSTGESRFAIGTRLNNDDGLLEVGNAALTFDTPALSNQRGIVRHLGSGGLNLDMALLGQAGGDFITNSAVSLSAEEWVNSSLLQAASLTLDIDRLTQTSTGGLLAVNSLSTSGDSWVNDGRIETNGNLELRLSGDYRGNGSLLSQGNLLLDTKRVELGESARVRGAGSVSVSVLGELASVGQLTAGTWLKLAVGALNNRGTLGAAGDLLVHAPKMHNDGGLIFSGTNMTLLGDELTNRRGDIYSLGNLFFAQNDAGDKAKRFSNVSGTVESAGTLTFASGLLENLREDFDIVKEKISAHFIYLGCGNCGGSKEASYFDLVEIDRTRGSNNSPQAQLLSGSTMTLHSDSLDNRYSLISAGADLLIDTQALSNLGAQAADVTTTRWVHLHRVYMSEVSARRAEADAFNARNWIGSSRYNPGDITAELNDFLRRHLWEAYLSAGPTYSNQIDYSGILQAAGKVTIQADKELNSSVIRPGFAYVSGGNRVGNTGIGNGIATYITLNPQLPPDLAQKAVDPLSLPGFSLPGGQNGLFSLSTNPAHPYLIETNSAFANLGNFLNSSYLLDQLAYNPDHAQKLLGDGLYEQRLIRDAIVARTGQRFLAGLTSDEAQFRYLMDNAIASKDALQLSVGVGLSAEQIAALTHDIVWMEEREVNGQKVLAPVVYLAQAEGRLAPSGALIQGRDLTLISGGELVNQGTLRATQNLNVTAQQNIANSGLMHADGRLSLLAGESIRNIQGGILKGQDVSLVAVAGDVINERTVSTHQSATRNTDRQQSFVDRAARIEAGNDLQVSAGNDIRNIGGAISAGRDASLEAGNDLILGSAEAESRQNSWDRKGHSYQNSITQYGSDVQVGRDLDAVAGRDLLVVGSTVKAGGNIDLDAGGDMTISSAADERHSDYYRKSGGKTVISQKDHVKQVASVIEAGGNLSAQADGNLVLASSHLKAGNEAYLYAGEQLALIANQNTDYSLYDKKKKGGWGSKETQRDEVTTVRNIGSTITTGGNLSLISEGDQLYQKARLESGNNLTLESGGAITFEAVKDLDQESHEKSSNSLAWTSAKGKGTTDETLLQTQMIAQGELAIKAVDGLRIDVKEVNQQTVSQAIDAMAKADSNLAWIKEAEARGDVDWLQVKEIHDSFKYSHSGLGAGAQIVIAIVVAYFAGPLLSQGIGSLGGATAAAGSGTAMAASGTATASAVAAGATAGSTVAAGWANAALTAVATGAASGATTSAINNRGNLGAVLKDVTSDQALKGYAVGGVTAGLTAGLYDKWTSTETGANTAGTATANTGALANSGAVAPAGGLSSWSGVGQFATNQALQNSTSAVLNKALGQDGSLGDALQMTLANTFMAAGFNWVGDITRPGAKLELKDGTLAKAGLHAVMGGLAAEALGGDFKTGALAAGVNELLVDKLDAQYKEMGIKDRKALLVMNSQLVGVLTAGLQGGDAESLQVGAAVAGNATQHNYLTHRDVEEMEFDLHKCNADGDCERNTRAKYQNRSAENNKRLNACSANGNCDAIKLEVEQGKAALSELAAKSGLSGDAQKIVGSMSSGQENDLFHLGTRIVADKINQKRNEDLVALGNNKEAFNATVKLRALEAYQSSLEQELAANQQLLEYSQKSDAELDQLVPGWRESRDQYARSAKAVADGFSTVGEIVEPGLIDIVGPTAKAAKLAGIFITLEKAGKLVPDGVLKVASRLDSLLSGKAPSAELIPFEKVAESKLTQDIRVANQALASRNTPNSSVGGPKAIDDSAAYTKWWDNVAQPKTLTDREARAWYLSKEAEIPSRIDAKLSLEYQAKQAFSMRNDLRSTARELMSNRSLADSLNKSDPNRTWSEIVNKYSSQGLSGDGLWRKIIEKSQSSRASVNDGLGM